MKRLLKYFTKTQKSFKECLESYIQQQKDRNVSKSASEQLNYFKKLYRIPDYIEDLKGVFEGLSE